MNHELPRVFLLFVMLVRVILHAYVKSIQTAAEENYIRKIADCTSLRKL